MFVLDTGVLPRAAERDAHSAALMRQHGIKAIPTHVTDVNRLPWTDAVGPLQDWCFSLPLFPEQTGHDAALYR